MLYRALITLAGLAVLWEGFSSTSVMILLVGYYLTWFGILLVIFEICGIGNETVPEKARRGKGKRS
jgi:hypothetical protein